MTKYPPTRLLAAILEIQDGRADAEMAREFGVSRNMWCYIRRGERKLSLPLIQRILATYPQLMAAHLEDMQTPPPSIAQ